MSVAWCPWPGVRGLARKIDCGAADPQAPWHPGLAAIDFRTVIRGHYRATGVEVPRFGERLRCYELHIGLTHLAYCAFASRDREDDLWAVARRTRGILGSDGG